MSPRPNVVDGGRPSNPDGLEPRAAGVQLTAAEARVAPISTWRKILDTLIEIFTFSLAYTRTYNHEVGAPEWRELGRHVALRVGEPLAQVLERTPPDQLHEALLNELKAHNPGEPPAKLREMATAMLEGMYRVAGSGPLSAEGFTRLDRIRALMRKGGEREEAQILDLLRSAAPAELDAFVRQLSMTQLLDSVDNHIGGPNHYTALLHLLCRERLGDLSVAARARLVDGLQTGLTTGSEELAIRDVFLGTHGVELTALKRAIDRGGDDRDLMRLVFSDIDSEQIRTEILAHIAREAQSQAHLEVKILSDIDDTFYANWRDSRYPSKTVYPGVRELYAELDRGPGVPTSPEGDLVFVTARPNDGMGVMEGLTHRTLRQNGLSETTVLTGDFLHLLTNDAIAEGKERNFHRFRTLYPEFDFVWIGDNGQGDATFGATINAQAPELVRGALIHAVVPMSDAQRADFEARGIVFFDTYVGAAITAYERGLISAQGLRNVAQGAMASLRSITFSNDEQRRTITALLERDVARMEQVLAAPPPA